MARALDDKTDAMIFSLTDDMMALSLQSKDLSQDNSFATSSNVEERKIVLQFYDDVISFGSSRKSPSTLTDNIQSGGSCSVNYY